MARCTMADFDLRAGSCPRSQVEEKISDHPDWLRAQSCDAALAVVVIWAGDAIFSKFKQEV